MTTNAKVLLFYTPFCHLCDQAVAIFDQLNITVEKKDIIDDDVLMARYGKLIPVATKQDTQKELHWPFDVDAVLEWLEVKV